MRLTFICVGLDLCCLIPGKVIDEIFPVLRTIQTDENPPRAYEILQELRDIASTAMEYFDEKIVPCLPKQLVPVPPLKFGSPGSYISGIGGLVKRVVDIKAMEELRRHIHNWEHLEFRHMKVLRTPPAPVHFSPIRRHLPPLHNKVRMMRRVKCRQKTRDKMLHDVTMVHDKVRARDLVIRRQYAAGIAARKARIVRRMDQMVRARDPVICRQYAARIAARRARIVRRTDPAICRQDCQDRQSNRVRNMPPPCRLHAAKIAANSPPKMLHVKVRMDLLTRRQKATNTVATMLQLSYVPMVNTTRPAGDSEVAQGSDSAWGARGQIECSAVSNNGSTVRD